eukprot:Nk52_evm24s233 gene=Nk52_evmTU24s233
MEGFRIDLAGPIVRFCRHCKGQEKCNQSTAVMQLCSLVENGALDGDAMLRDCDRQKVLDTIALGLLDASVCAETVVCFSPILRDLLDRCVDVGRVLVQNGERKQSEVHDSMAFCFATVLSFDQAYADFVLDYYKCNPSLFSTLEVELSRGVERVLSESYIEQLLYSAFCIFSHCGGQFKVKWNFVPLLDLLTCDNFGATAKYYACRILGVILGLTEGSLYELFNRFIGQQLNENQLAIQTIRYSELKQILSAKLLLNEGVWTCSEAKKDGRSMIVESKFLKNNTTDVCGVLLSRQGDEGVEAIANSMQRSDVELTETFTSNLKSLALALKHGSSGILVQGVHGCGKTTLVETLYRLLHQEEQHGTLLKLHLGDQSDSKMLLGNYVCTDVPGKFEWQAGALTRAVREGRWILIEDIDIAPSDIISVLIPLLEERCLFIPGRGETIRAASGFQLFATQSLNASGSTRKTVNSEMIESGGMWLKSVVHELPFSELKDIISCKYSSLKLCVNIILNLYQDILGFVNDCRFSENRFDREYSCRDLFKVCARVHKRIAETNVVVTEVTFDLIRERVYLEFVDCFCGMISCLSTREKLNAVICVSLGMDLEKMRYFLNFYKCSVSKTGQGFLEVGRASVKSIKSSSTKSETKNLVGLLKKQSTFAYTKHSLCLLEKLAVAVDINEPVLLVGETGTGKTTAAQHLAEMLGQKMVVVNMSQQSDSSDLLGGYKPVDLRMVCTPLLETFEEIFPKTFSKKANTRFYQLVLSKFNARQWAKLVTLFRNALQMVQTRINNSKSPSQNGDDVGNVDKNKKVGKPLSSELQKRWASFANNVEKFESQREQLKNSFAFSFVEGTLTKALRKGEWILLDEINLATQETLECLSGLLENENESLVLSERGDIEPVSRHPNFRVFACMNPATDVGKKDLPPGLRNRFSEYYVDEITDENDLRTVVNSYLECTGEVENETVDSLVKFFLEVKKAALETLKDSANRRPHYSLRTLCRALDYCRMTFRQYGFRRALYEGVSMSFFTQLDSDSYKVMSELIQKYIQREMPAKVLTAIPNAPGSDYVLFEQFWIRRGPEDAHVPQNYIITPSIGRNLRNVARAIVATKFPVLLQGPTSSGKTSMIEYIATCAGHRFVRVNNHEHTDLQEYMGRYVSDSQGKLVFQEGVLVEALRKGHWIVLDELNLAPTDLLEALNRLLDDNRELLIPETQEVVKPHPNFMLFATQNPAGLYGGRKMLSRAFRNRFIELHFDDIPQEELETILSKRCVIPPTYCKKLVLILKELQSTRQGTKLFSGKTAFITLRDLFRWAERRPNGYEELARDGFCLLAERIRNPEEKVFVKSVIEKILKVKIDEAELYSGSGNKELENAMRLCHTDDEQSPFYAFREIVWTESMRRLFVIVQKCLMHKEPILLVGETGCGKTTICQLIALLYQKQLHAINCHQHTESSDFIGGLRPMRGKYEQANRLLGLLKDIFESPRQFGGGIVVERAVAITEDDFGTLCDTLKDVLHKVNADCSVKEHLSKEELALLASMEEAILLYGEYQTLFVWHNGPLISAMNTGDHILIDEISLADDSVLERLNSVLEPSRLLVLAEKGGIECEEIRAHGDFRILATMNPGGDFGKKELSPALRNRFTEIWVPNVEDRSDRLEIIDSSLANKSLKSLKFLVLNFIDWFHSLHQSVTISLRDILAWVKFINCAYEDIGVREAYTHGACLTFLDGLGMSLGAGPNHSEFRKSCLEYLNNQMKEFNEQINLVGGKVMAVREGYFGIAPFCIEKGPIAAEKHNYTVDAPTICENMMRVLRGLQLHKPILLEGSPGVGKTSLVNALAKLSGHQLVRINLSEQTDIMDLFGADLPVENGNSGEFEWRDGVFLKAMKEGNWILLDELNLASQSVLEGLNACLDHRSSIYIPELDLNVDCPTGFRIFGAQNPTTQGGGRKGLPKSFLNRFTKIYVDQLSKYDLEFIANAHYPEIGTELISRMIAFNGRLFEETMVKCSFGTKGSPWEFNLRDVFRWCDLMRRYQCEGKFCPGNFLKAVYIDRMRDAEDREKIIRLYNEVFAGENAYAKAEPESFLVTKSFVQIGQAILPRNDHAVGFESTEFSNELQVLQKTISPLETLATAVDMNWLSILVGPAASGKTSMVRLLAELTGNELQEYAMNSSIDTMELLGGFEQVDMNRKVEDVKKELRDGSRLLIARCIQSAESNINHEDRQQSLVYRVVNSWNVYEMRMQQGDVPGSSTPDIEDKQPLLHLAESLCKLQAEFPMEFDCLQFNPSHCFSVLQSVLDAEKNGSFQGKFEWVDGMLVKAIENGHWLLVDNVNFCSSSVLDRLNPLFEPGGVLAVNERGVIDGAIKLVKPHKNFRMFFAMDSKYGEISRAMRNRGIEICLLDGEYGLQDSLRLLNSAGIAGSYAARILFRVHDEVGKELAKGYMNDDKLCIRDLLNFAKLTRIYLDCGRSFSDAVSDAALEVYARTRKRDADRSSVTNCIRKVLSDTELSFELVATNEWVFAEPGVWPSFVSGRYLNEDASLYSIQADGALFRNYLCEGIASAPAKLHDAVPFQMLGIDQTFQISEVSVPSEEVSIFSRNMLACKFVIESASIRDWEVRKQWLLYVKFKSYYPPDWEFYLNVAIECMEVVFSSPGLKSIYSMRETLSGQSSEMVYSLPWSFRNNEELANNFFVLAKQNSTADDFEKLWTLHSNMSSQLECMVHERMISLFEKNALAKGISVPFRSMSPYCQSYLLHIGDAEQSSLLFEESRWIYPLFQVLSIFCRKLLSVESDLAGHVSLPTDCVKKMGMVNDIRCEMFSVVNGSSFSRSSFCVVWSKFVVNMTLVLDTIPTVIANSLMDVFVHLGNIVDTLNRLCGTKDWEQKLLFGKSCGIIPFARKDADLFQLELDIRRCGELLNIASFAQLEDNQALLKFVRNSSSVEQMRKLIAESVATIRITDYMNEHGKGRQVLAELHKVPSILHKLSTDALAENSSYEAEKQGSLSLPLVKPAFLDVATISYQDYIGLGLESIIIRKLCALTRLCYKRESGEIVKEHAREIWKFVERLVALHGSSRSPRCPTVAATYQRLLWVLDSFLTSSKPEKYSSFHLALRSELTSCIVNFFTRIWDNCFDDIRCLDSNEDVNSNVNNSKTMQKGSFYGFFSVQMKIVRTLRCSFESIPICFSSEKASQYKTLVGDLIKELNEAHCVANEVEDRSMFTNMMAIFFQSCVKYFSSTVFEKMTHALDELSMCFIHYEVVAACRAENLAAVIVDSFKQMGTCTFAKEAVDIISLIMSVWIEALTTKMSASQELLCLSKLWFYLGQLNFVFVRPENEVDPASQIIFKLKSNENLLAVKNVELAVEEQYRKITTNCLSSNKLEHIREQIRLIEDDIAKLKDSIPLRPQVCQFSRIFVNVSNFNDSVVKSKKCSLLIENLCDGIPKTPMQRGEFLAQVEVVQESQQQFVKDLLSDHPFYYDITGPIAMSCYFMMHGLRIASTLFEGQVAKSLNQGALDGAVVELGRFPMSKGSEEVASVLDVAFEIFSSVKGELFDNRKSSKKLQVLATSLTSLFNRIKCSGRLLDEHIKCADVIFSSYCSHWHLVEKEKRRLIEEEEGLYKFKTISHNVETDEEEFERDYKAMFPEFDTEYLQILKDSGDLEAENALSAENKSCNTENLNRSKTVVGIPDSDAFDIVAIHRSIYTMFHAYSQNSKNVSCKSILEVKDLQMEFTQSYQSAEELISSFPSNNLSRNEESQISLGSALAMKIDERELSFGRDVADKPMSNESLYDIYKDSNVREVLKCKDVLLGMSTRISDLLIQWPEHPILLVLVNLIKKILSFPVSSPVMKILAGLELLLKKSQDWEQYAAKHVSLKEALTSISNLIIEWRKLELKCWPFLLQSKEKAHELKAGKFWFHLYQMIDHGAAESALVGGTNNMLDESYMKQLFENVSQLLETASLGEFFARLNIVKAFYFNVDAKVKSLEIYEEGGFEGVEVIYFGRLRTILMNVHKYYSQYKTAVETELKKLRTPIEKELKDFVKICRWNDVNYWAVKQSSEKAHRTLHKFAKQYEIKLGLKASEAWRVDEKANSSEEISSGPCLKAGSTLSHIPKFSLDSLKNLLPTTVDGEYLAKMLLFNRRLAQFQRKELGGTSTVRLAVVVDQFASQVIETVKELQSEENTFAVDDAKKKGALKLRKQMRQKGLSDLLKYLRTIGLKYRSSSLILNQQSNQYVFEQGALLSLVRNEDGKASEASYGQELVKKSENYFFKLFSMVSKLRSLRNKCSSDIPPAIADRCAGYVEVMFYYILKERKALGNLVEVREQLDCVLERLGKAVEKGEIGCFRSSRALWRSLKSLKYKSDSLLLGAEQIKLAMQKDMLNGELGFTPEDETIIGGLLSDVSSVCADVSAAFNAEIPVMYICEKLKSDIVCVDLGMKIECIESRLSNMSLEMENYCSRLSPSQRKLLSGIRSSLSKAEISTPEPPLFNYRDFNDSAIEGSVDAVLISVQKLITEEKHISSTCPIALDNEDIPAVSDLSEGYLISLHETMMHYADILNIQTHCESVVQLLAAVANANGTTDWEGIVLKLKIYHSLITKYAELADKAIFTFSAHHKSFCKLAYVLVNMFSELFENGFCTPKEEQPTEMEDHKGENLSGTGVGEGQGEKDVTDEIENEDQIAGTENEEKGEQPEKNDDKEKDKDAEDNAFEMTDDFDGELEDVEKKERENDDEHDDEEENEEDLDKKMGDLDQAKADVVDEKMWGEDEDDKDENPSENEKSEMDSSMKGMAEDDSLVADESTQEKKEKEREEKTDSEETKKDEKKTQDSDETKDDEKKNDGDDEDEIDGEINEQNVEENLGFNFEETTNTNDEEKGDDNMELPEDMNLDDEDGEDEDDGLECDAPDPNEIAEGPDEKMDIDDDSKEFPEQQPEQAEENNSDDAPGDMEEEKQDEGTSEKDDDTGDVADEEEECEGEQPSGEDDELAMDLDRNDVDSSNEKHDDKRKGEEENQELEHDKEKNKAQDHKDISMGEGVEDESGEQNAGNNEEMDDNEDMSAFTDMNNSGTASSMPDSSNVEQKKQKDSSEREQSRSERKFETNPLRNLGDALKEWKDRLKVIGDEDADEKEEHAENDEGSSEPNADDEFEFINQDSNSYDGQTLASRDENQQQDVDLNANQNEEEEDPMDVDESDKLLENKKEAKEEDSNELESKHEVVDKSSASNELNQSSNTEEKKNEDGSDENNGENAKSKKNAGDDEAEREKEMRSEVFTGSKTEIDLEALKLTEEEMIKSRAELEEAVGNWREGKSTEEGRALWQKYELVTGTLAMDLCEQLRLILEPTIATKMKGDYRTGKRLNMKKIIPYIASQFKKDKIWLRRTKPSKRDYQVMVSIDNSESMSDNRSVQMAFEALTLISKALSQLEVGDISISTFGDSFEVVHPFGSSFTPESGSNIMHRFTFDQQSTDVVNYLEKSMAFLDLSKHNSSSQNETSQLQIIVSDGRGFSDVKNIAKWVRMAAEKNIMICFIVIDNPESEFSIADYQSVKYVDGKLQVQKYMDSFPFPYYILLRDINALPSILSDALRQWFELVAA